MRIGLDARTTEGNVGVAQYGRHLTQALVAAAGDDAFVIFRREPNPLPFWTAHVSDRWRFVNAKLDLLHVLGGATPLGYRHPYVLTVHDLAIYQHPEWFPEGQWFSTRVSYPSAIKLAQEIIVPSLATKKDLMELFKVKEEKISVIRHGVSMPPLLIKEREGVRYLLFLGTIEPRKNVSTIVRAYRMMVDRHPELKEVELRLAGAVGWRANEIVDAIRQTQCEGYRITLVGEVSEDDKWQLLAGAMGFLFPSLYEGFGLPVAEALAVGVPVVCSGNSSLPEVSGQAALLVDAMDVEGWMEKMTMILTDKKTTDELRTKGLARVKDFSWEKTAEETLKVYRRLIA